MKISLEAIIGIRNFKFIIEKILLNVAKNGESINQSIIENSAAKI